MPHELSLVLCGEGAIARIHAQEIAKIDGAKIAALVPGDREAGVAFAAEFGIPDLLDIDAALATRPDGVILATPSDLHAAQAERVIAADLKPLVEIPMATRAEECEALARHGAAAMVAHTRRFSPAHRAMKARIEAGDTLHHLVAETYFMRRENLNMRGEPRSWVDSLIWHHAVHSIDLLVWLTGDPAPEMRVIGGALHPEMGCLMDATILLRSRTGTMLSLVMSFNNEGPFGGFYRYICESGTYHVFRDALKDAKSEPLDAPGAPAFAAQTAAYLAWLRGEAAPEPNLADALPAMRLAAAAADELEIER